jgi:hypothetical protein
VVTSEDAAMIERAAERIEQVTLQLVAALKEASPAPEPPPPRARRAQLRIVPRPDQRQ